MGRLNYPAAESTYPPKRTRSYVTSCSLRMVRSERRSSNVALNASRALSSSVGPPVAVGYGPTLDAILQVAKEEVRAHFAQRILEHDLAPPLPFNAQPVGTLRGSIVAANVSLEDLVHHIPDVPLSSSVDFVSLNDSVWNGPAGQHFRRQAARTAGIGGGRSTSPISVDGSSDCVYPTASSPQLTTTIPSFIVSTELALPAPSPLLLSVAPSPATPSWSVHPLMASSSSFSNGDPSAFS
jgi:hypothetical protein